MLLPAIFGEDLFDDFMDPYDMDEAFDREMSREMRSLSPRRMFGKRGANVMKTDVKQTDKTYELAVDLPGFRKEDVHLDVKDGYLTIAASRSHDSGEKDKAGRFIRQERCTGACVRSFYVGESVKPSDVTAKFEDGILKISLPRTDVKRLPADSAHLIEIQ